MNTTTINQDALTVFQRLQVLATSQPQAVAIRFHGRDSLDYADLLDAIENIKSILNQHGLTRNDRIAVVYPNGPEMALSVLGILSCASCAPLNPKYTFAEFKYYLQDLNIKAVIVKPGLKSPVREACSRLNIKLIEVMAADETSIGPLTIEVDRQQDNHAAANDSGFALETDTALILHTSGTTSKPKIVPITQKNLLISARNIATTLQLQPQDSCFNIMPLFHIHGMMAGLLAPLVSGGSVICSPGFAEDPFFVAQFFPWLVEMQPSWYTAVPTMHQAILASANKHPDIARQCRLRLIRSSSASLAPQVMMDLEGVFKTSVIEAYGMTEATHQMTSNPLPPAPRKPKSVGMAAGPEVAIMDSQGQMLPAGQKGEIVIRGDNVMHAYENNEDANALAFFDDWFRTGDEGILDEQHYLFITGRLKEMINRGGEKISPREIDEVLLEHPAVAQAVTFAAPHPTLGEVAAAAVIVRDGHNIDIKDLQTFASKKLASFKLPNPIVFVDEIPKGPTGKLQRIGLANKLL